MPNNVADETALLSRLNGDVAEGTFQYGLGLRFIAASRDRVDAMLTVAPAQISRPGVMHGGALMAFADTVGGFTARINLAPGQSTTTLESKTNFLRAAAPGTVLTARAQVLHRGRTTIVVQISIEDETGRRIALTTQTQMVLIR